MELKEIVRRQFERVDSGDLDAFAAQLAPHCTWMSPGAELNGPEEIRELMATYNEAFPDGRHEIEIATVGEKAFVEGTWTGTHTGTLRTPEGDVPPTGRKVVDRFAGVIESRDGRITAVRIYWDMFEFMAQLGLVPEPAAA